MSIAGNYISVNSLRMSLVFFPPNTPAQKSKVLRISHRLPLCSFMALALTSENCHYWSFELLVHIVPLSSLINEPYLTEKV